MKMTNGTTKMPITYEEVESIRNKLLSEREIIDSVDYFSTLRSGDEAQLSDADKQILDKTKEIAEKGKDGKVFHRENSFYMVLEASHTGYVNNKYEFYTDKAAIKAANEINKKTYPFMLVHDMEKIPLGTILHAEWQPVSDKINDREFNGKPNNPTGVIKVGVVVNTTDETLRSALKNHLYNYVSIGGRGVEVVDSISGKSPIESGHYKGELVDDERVYYIYNDFRIFEISAVPVGADEFNRVALISDILNLAPSFVGASDYNNKDHKGESMDKVEELSRKVNDLGNVIDGLKDSISSQLVNIKNEIKDEIRKEESDLTEPGQETEIRNGVNKNKVEVGILTRQATVLKNLNRSLATANADMRKRITETESLADDLLGIVVDMYAKISDSTELDENTDKKSLFAEKKEEIINLLSSVEKNDHGVNATIADDTGIVTPEGTNAKIEDGTQDDHDTDDILPDAGSIEKLRLLV